MTTGTLARIPRDIRPRIRWGTGTAIDTSAYDDVSSYYLNSPGISVDGIGRDQDRAYSPGKAPALELTLSNHDGTFSPGGPLAVFLGRGPETTLEIDHGVDVLSDADDVLGDDLGVLGDGSSTWTLFSGFANSMEQAINRSSPASVAVSALGVSSSLLVRTKPTTILYESIRTDQAVTIILDAVGWDAATRVIDTGSTTLLYFWLNGDLTGRDALERIRAAEGAGACWYEDGDGNLHFQGRDFREDNPSSNTVQWVFSDGVISGNPTGDDPLTLGDAVDVLGDGPLENPLFHVGEPSYTMNPDEIVKTVVQAVNVRTPTPTQTIGTERMKIWEYGGPLVLSNNEVRDVKVTSSDPFKSAVTPVLATDYSVAVGSLVSVSLLATSGQTIVSRWTAGAAGCTLNGPTSAGPQVRAISLPVTTTLPVTSTVNTASASARTNEEGPTDLGAWAEVEPLAMLDVVNERALRYQRGRPQIAFQVQNIDAAHLYAMLTLRVSDRIQFIHTHALLNIVAWVEQINYLIAPGGGLITVTVGCEQVFDISGGVFDTARFDIDSFGI